MNETDSPPDDRATDGAVERWLQDKVLPAYDAHRADPSRVLTPDEVSGC